MIVLTMKMTTIVLLALPYDIVNTVTVTTVTTATMITTVTTSTFSIIVLYGSATITTSRIITTTTTTETHTHSTYKWVPESILGFLDLLFHLYLITILQSLYYDYHQFNLSSPSGHQAGRIEAQKG